MFLEKAGAEISFAKNVPEALLALDEVNPAIILTDIELGAESGFDLLRRLRINESLSGKKRTPVIAMSAHIDDESRRRIQTAGFDLEFQKPIVVANLADAIARIMDQSAWLAVQPQEVGG